MPTAVQGHSEPSEASRLVATQKRAIKLPTDAFGRLDDDSLLDLLEHVIACGSLRPLSTTCKWIREACKPILFRRCRLRMPYTFSARYFIPEMMWPYVRSLFLHCNFPYLEYETDTYFDPPDGYDDVYAPLTAKLCCMPKLQTITLSHTTGEGVPWEAINAIVQIPQLRSLRILGLLDDRHILPPETEQSLRLSINSLAAIDYTSSGYRRASATEIKLFSVLLRQVTTQRSLEALSIPSECAPLDCLSTTEFPRLRELSFIGRRQVIMSHADGQQHIPYISILTNMPRLRKLSLTLAQPIDLPRQEIWPTGVRAEFPCPDLQDLSVSYPHPDDEFYAHLPSTLQRLALRCWPRHYLHLLDHDIADMTKLGWYSPILSSSETLRILRRCPSHSVRRLEVEFEEDDSGSDLFRCVPNVFPQLQYLIVHRYRRAGVDITPVAALAQALAPLRDLRVLLCNLDFEDAPDPFGTHSNFDLFDTTLQRAADVLAGSLPLSVEVIGLLLRQDVSSRYVCFRIIHDGHGTRRAERDNFMFEVHGIFIGDMSSLSRPERPH
ncbi:hypothetical protein LXA43DRAFT_360583 [Ganoderma leucocontextum]|nr:hypothetical protein LXA43DRAFT_360583 [Ganoderma leucocontextum]